MSKLFTIIICAYNAELRLERTLDSIINQYKYDELVDKLIIVDNNSKDNTKAIVMKYKESVINIQYLFESNQGLSNARLCGVNNANSEWIIFVDDDNILQEKWIQTASEYIESKNNIGAFNGAVIPEIDYELSEEQAEILKNTYKGLACTHLTEPDIKKGDYKHPNKIPFGAGLVIRTKSLKILADKGWLKSEGRKGNKLISGEDTELCMFIKNEGYELGYNPNMLIKHVIFQNRLQVEYSINIYKSFAQYSYEASSRKSVYLIRRIRMLILNSCIFVKILIKSAVLKNISINDRIYIEMSKTVISNIMKDKLILRGKNYEK